nr:unnamed protein product [Spirometra erinaceieuropaei]
MPDLVGIGGVISCNSATADLKSSQGDIISVVKISQSASGCKLGCDLLEAPGQIQAGETGRLLVTSRRTDIVRMISRNANNSFSAFQTSVDDAWEADDDEYLTISKSVAEKTAQAVIESHTNEVKGIRRPIMGTFKSSPNTSVKQAPGCGVRLSAANDSVLTLSQPSVECRIAKFQSVINSPVTDLQSLRRLAWSGIPHAVRSTVWKLLSDYLPASQERRAFTLLSKRKQYADLAGQFFSLRNHHSGSDIFLQIQKDLLRMPILHRHQEIFDLFERVLFIWSVRHPGSGYVQGINDLLTPFFVVFLSDYVKTELTSSGELNLSAPVEAAQLAEIEADVFWCLSRLLDTIQDNYTFAQPGIQNNIAMLTSLTERLDADLHQHFLSQNLEYLQFSFRWMNNLLIRELPLRCIIRLWDTYLAEPDGFSHFHVYVCAAFLMHFADELKRQRDFQSLMLYLQRLPTQRWGNDDVQMVLAEAFRLKSLFFYAPKHLDYRKKDIE